MCTRKGGSFYTPEYMVAAVCDLRASKKAHDMLLQDLHLAVSAFKTDNLCELECG